MATKIKKINSSFKKYFYKFKKMSQQHVEQTSKRRMLTVGELKEAKIEDLPPSLHKIKRKIDEDFKNDIDLEMWDKIIEEEERENKLFK